MAPLWVVWIEESTQGICPREGSRRGDIFWHGGIYIFTSVKTAAFVATDIMTYFEFEFRQHQQQDKVIKIKSSKGVAN